MKDQMKRFSFLSFLDYFALLSSEQKSGVGVLRLSVECYEHSDPILSDRLLREKNREETKSERQCRASRAITKSPIRHLYARVRVLASLSVLPFLRQ